MLFGCPASGIVGQRFRDRLTTAGNILYETQFMPAMRLQEKVEELLFEVVCLDGGRTPVLVSGVLEKGLTCVAQSALLVLFRAGQRRQYEQELLAKRKEFEQAAEIIDRSSDAIVRLSAQLVVESWNEGAKEIFGFMRKEALGQHLSTLLIPEAAETLVAQLARPGVNTDITLETSARRKNGTLVDVSMRLTPHLAPPGKTVGFSAILRDTTSKKLAERALLQADKLASVGRLASSISHELNNPLAAVTNLLYLLQTGAKDEETRSLVETAQSELARVSHIATHTLRFHQQSTRKTEVDIRALFLELLSLFQGRFAGSQIVATADAETRPTLVCYEGELKQVLVNIISNSFHAMRHGGRLLLRCQEVTAWKTMERAIRITIVDDGTGMSPETCRNLFEPFFSTKGINGVGLGLWISKELVERNGGVIRVRSKATPVSHGTVVSMLFPKPSH